MVETQDYIRTKITIIEDINKGINFLFGRNINADEFDIIYDMNVAELENMFNDLQKHINLIIQR